MGCGKRNFGPGWIHIDQSIFKHIDESNIFDFSYKNVDLIYASHLISYFDYDTCYKLLEYWYSKLRTGGILRLAVPNFEAICKLYIDNKYSLESFVGPLYGRMISDEKEIFHKFCYDQKTLTKLLLKLNYKNIRLWDHKKVEHGLYDDHSQAYLPHFDKENGTLISLNLECEK